MSIDSILTAMYSGAAQSSPALSSNPVIAMAIAEKTETTAVANEAKQPQVVRDLTAFKTAVAAAKSPTQLLQNPTVLKVLLTINGLADQLPYTALAQKALLSDPTKGDSLANQLSGSNGNWLTAAKAYAFSSMGLSVIKNPTTVAGIANAYAQQTWMTSLDQGTPGLSNALAFRTKASQVTSVDQILGDATLRTVVTTALGIPPQIAFQSLSAQETAIKSHVDISQFKNPTFVENFAQRYLLAAADAANAAAPTGNNLTSLSEQASLLA